MRRWQDETDAKRILRNGREENERTFIQRNACKFDFLEKIIISERLDEKPQTKLEEPSEK